jgi:hypothetical protein
MSDRKITGKRVGKVVEKVPEKIEMYNGRIAEARALDPMIGDDNLMLSIFHQNEGMSNEDVLTLVNGFTDMPDDEIFIKMLKDAEKAKGTMKMSPRKKRTPMNTAPDISKSVKKAGNVSDDVVLDMAYTHASSQQKRGRNK